MLNLSLIARSCCNTQSRITPNMYSFGFIYIRPWGLNGRLPAQLPFGTHRVDIYKFIYAQWSAETFGIRSVTCQNSIHMCSGIQSHSVQPHIHAGSMGYEDFWPDPHSTLKC
jgi:hypothetical protein